MFFFAAFMIDGEPIATTKVEVMPNTPAKAADLRNGDKIISIDGAPINDWEQMREVILKNPNRPLVIGVQRDGRETKINVTPEPKADRGGGQIGVKPVMVRVPMAAKEAAKKSVIEPARVVQALVVGLAASSPERKGPAHRAGRHRARSRQGSRTQLGRVPVLAGPAQRLPGRLQSAFLFPRSTAAG